MLQSCILYLRILVRTGECFELVPVVMFLISPSSDLDELHYRGEKWNCYVNWILSLPLALFPLIYLFGFLHNIKGWTHSELLLFVGIKVCLVLYFQSSISNRIMVSCHVPCYYLHFRSSSKLLIKLKVLCFIMLRVNVVVFIKTLLCFFCFDDSWMIGLSFKEH